MSKKILITGGAGFIGSHLCERLVKCGHELVSLDNYFTGTENNHIPGVKYIRGSTQSINRIKELHDFRPSLVYHLGEYSRVEQSFEDIDLVHDCNINGTFSVLEYCRKYDCKLVYAGSSTKYADKSNYIVSPYAWMKAHNSDLVKKYCGLWYDLDYAVTYFYNVYGKREIATGSYSTLIAKFNEKMKNNETLPVVSPGTQERNFTHVDDIVHGLILIGAYGYGDEYGIGNPNSYTVLDVAEMFGGEIEMLPERKGNRMTAEVITEKTRNLGWVPKKDLETYIKGLNNERNS